MPAKRMYNDETSSSSTSSDTDSSDSVPQGPGKAVTNKPHDVEYNVEDTHRETPPRDERAIDDLPVRGAAPAATTLRPAGGQMAGGQLLQNNPNDEEHDADDGTRIPTPTTRPGGAAPTAVPSIATLQNQPHDEYEDAPEGIETVTPRMGGGFAGGAPPRTEAPPAAGVVRNRPHDEAHEVASDQSSVSPPRAMPQKMAAMPTKAAAKAAPQSAMAAPDESSDEEEAKPAISQYEYNPEEYAHLNSRVPREVQELFSHITAYQPTLQELPSKLRPFIPDYVPCVGDIDTFCKVPRPDGKPDNLGLIVVDEPCAKQSNPTVVKIGLQYVVKQTSSNFLFVDSLEDAANRPQAIDHWVAEIKQLHYKKPLPTVSYSKPMPEIETLLQAWPQEFEELLASDVQMPPPNIDLDIDQYVRVLCAILDVPCYTNLVESLHVMFTLYLEFRQNQHFQHA